jgi:hypothetical protein
MDTTPQNQLKINCRHESLYLQIACVFCRQGHSRARPWEQRVHATIMCAQPVLRRPLFHSTPGSCCLGSVYNLGLQCCVYCHGFGLLYLEKLLCFSLFCMTWTFLHHSDLWQSTYVTTVESVLQALDSGKACEGQVGSGWSLLWLQPVN